MKLVLAEKPSVAQSIAKVLGATKREDGYLEGNGYVVSWCVGHLVELSQPEAYDEKYNKWAYADLPIFPDQWKYQVSASTKKQFGILKKLMARKDVESLVCATDAGREGELIFRLVYQQAGCRKPFERLWISSMEDSAIREGFEQLKPSTEYDALYEAALCRERADWLVGINATRLFSTLYGQTLNVGRVMTPTLAMVVMREAAISAFRPEPFYTVELAFQDFTASGERMKQKVLADDVARKCVGSVLNVTKAENKEKSEKPPALYDLTSLQRDANRVLGFTAQQTLDYTQSLYEKKLVTYPRTDSRYLTSDMKDMLPELIKSLFNIFPVEDVKNVPVHAAQVINDKKVSDHHAIIPTKEAIKCSLDDLPKGEQAILRLIATRLFCAVGEPFRYNESVIELSDGNYIFSAKGKTTVQSGWKIFSGKPADKDKEGEKQLPSLTVGEGLSVYSTEVKEGKTSPPKHFTEDTLLQSMETAGADFQNVFDFNTRQTVNALGTAVNAVSSRMFGEIEKAIEAFEQTKTVERSHDYERNDLHTGRGLPDSGHRTEEHRNETVGQVRQNAEGVSAREQSDVAERSDSQRAAVPASPGDRRDSAPQSGAADDRTAGEESGTGQSNTADGMGEAHEQPESTGRGNRDSGAYQQLSLNLFLSESEQISFIDEAESKTLSAFSLSENQIDQVLTVGGNEANLRMMVALEYMKGKSTEEIAKRLPALYRGSNGFKLDSHEVSAWFDEQCIHLARGKTARFAPSRQIVSWQEAAERIGKLLENGEYATNVELVEAPGYERTKVAESLWYLYHDLSDNAREQGFFPSLQEVRSVGFPAETAELAEKLNDSQFRAGLKAEYQNFLQAHNEDSSLLRFHYHKLERLAQRLDELDLPLREYQSSISPC